MMYKPYYYEEVITVPAGQSVTKQYNLYGPLIKTVNLVNIGADITSTVTVNGYSDATTVDLVNTFGEKCVCEITVEASNAGTGDETLTLIIKGVEIWRN